MHTALRTLIGATLLFAGAAAHAQLSAVDGGSTAQPAAKFLFWVNPATNTLTVEVDNRLLAANNIAAAGADGKSLSALNVDLGLSLGGQDAAARWLQGNPGTTVLASQAAVPGISAAKVTAAINPSVVKFDDVTRFVFQAPSFDAAQQAGFYNSTPDLVAQWQSGNWTKPTFDSWAEIDWQVIAAAPPTPEPSTYGLIGAGALLALAVYRRRQAKQA